MHKRSHKAQTIQLLQLGTALLLLIFLALAATRIPIQARADTAARLLRSCFACNETDTPLTICSNALRHLVGFTPAEPASLLKRQLAICAVTPNAPTSPLPQAQDTPAAALPKNALPIVETSQTVAALQNTEGTNKSIYIDNDTSYSPDIAALLNAPLQLDINKNAPSVLIVHTHTTESYTPEAQSYYTTTDTTRTQDKSQNVVRVGAEIARTLTEAGINVLHDTTINDYPSYNGSYTKTLGIIEWYLNEYPSIRLVLDIHRDAMTKADGTKLKPVAMIQGEKAAQIMLVVGTNEGGLQHDAWQENLKLGLHLQNKLTHLYPKFARPLNLRKERFNQHATHGSLIVEVGADGNTLTEALAAGRYFATALSALLREAAE